MLPTCWPPPSTGSSAGQPWSSATIDVSGLNYIDLQARISAADLKIGDSHVMIGEASDQHPAMPGMVHLYVPDVDAVYRRAIAAGGTSAMEPKDQFYGDRGAGVQDPSGNHWYIATHIEDVPMAELKKRAEAMYKSQKGNAA